MGKLIACMPVRDEEWILAKSLADLSNYVDEIVIVDDGSTDRTPEIIRSFKKVTAIHTNPPGTLPFGNGQEYVNRNKTLDLARERGAEWILQIDADEMLESRAGRHLPKLLRKGCSVQFPIFHLWGDTEHFRVDGEWGKFYRWSLFRLHGRYAKRMRYGKNAIIAKPRAYDRKNTLRTDVKIVHYGWLDPRVRERSLRRYYEVYRLKYPQKSVSFEEFRDSPEMHEDLKIINQAEKGLKVVPWRVVMGHESKEKYRLCE